MGSWRRARGIVLLLFGLLALGQVQPGLALPGAPGPESGPAWDKAAPRLVEEIASSTGPEIEAARHTGCRLDADRGSGDQTPGFRPLNRPHELQWSLLVGRAPPPLA